MSDATVTRLSGVGMITIRGDFADAVFAKAVKSVCGLAIPGQREVVTSDAAKLVWMSPDELLLVVMQDQADGLVDELSRALAGVHHLVVNVSDARAVFDIEGDAAREVLAKGAPVDLSQAAFGPGQVRRSRLGQVAAAFWMTGDGSFELVCFQSVAGFVEEWLQIAARDGSFPEYL